MYAWLEIGIGIYGIMAPAIFSAGNGLFHALYDAAAGRPAILLAARAVCSFGLLLVPTFLMGGTYPAAIRYLTTSPDSRGRPLGLFYATNTAGAAAAAFLFPLCLLEWFGMSGVTVMAVGFNAIAAAGAFFLPVANIDTNQTPQPQSPRPLAPPLADPGASPYYIGAALFLSGFVALGLETLYNRLLILSFGSSIYSYSFILGVFLIGIGYGGRCFVQIEKRF